MAQNVKNVKMFGNSFLPFNKATLEGTVEERDTRSKNQIAVCMS